MFPSFNLRNLFSQDQDDESQKQKLLTALISISVPTVAVLAFWLWNNNRKKKSQGESGPLKIDEILVYPVKSLKGMSVDSWPIGPRGLVFDRQWMIIQKKAPVSNDAGTSSYKTDAEYTLVSQRQLPRMALIGSKVNLSNGTLYMYTPGHEPTLLEQEGDKLTVNTEHQYVMKSDFYSNENQFQRVNVELWGKSFELLDLGDDVSQWLCQVLNKSGLRLCMMPQDLNRAPDQYHYDYLNEEYGSSPNFKPVVQNNLSDDFPFHIATMNSLDELNKELTEKVDMIRFRPNFVIGRNQNLKPYSEEKWKRIEIVQDTKEENNPQNIVHMYNLQVKTRCTMPNVNPETGKRSEYGPFQKLRETHMNPTYDQPIFGINTVNTEADVGKIIKKGSIVRVLDYHSEPIARVPTN